MIKLSLSIAFGLAVFISTANVNVANANNCSSGTVVTSSDGTPLINGMGGPVCGGK